MKGKAGQRKKEEEEKKKKQNRKQCLKRKGKKIRHDKAKIGSKREIETAITVPVIVSK